MKLKELEDLVDTVYEIVGEGYSDDFKRIIGDVIVHLLQSGTEIFIPLLKGY